MEGRAGGRNVKETNIETENGVSGKMGGGETEREVEVVWEKRKGIRGNKKNRKARMETE